MGFQRKAQVLKRKLLCLGCQMRDQYASQVLLAEGMETGEEGILENAPCYEDRRKRNNVEHFRTAV